MSMGRTAGIVFAVGLVAGLFIWLTPQEARPPVGVQTVRLVPPPAGLIADLRTLAFAEEFPEAQRRLERYRDEVNQDSPVWLAAVSWVARGASFAGQWGLAERYAREVLDRSEPLLAARPLDADAELPTAVGAAIEVLGQARDARGDRAGAVAFLHAQRDQYAGTSIEMRIQKNVLLLSLEGTPFPVLDVEEHIGVTEQTVADLKGRVVLVYFWAHWCPDCKRQRPVLDALHATYADRGLAIIGPTQLWGYVAGGVDATPAEELAYVRGAYQEQYPIPAWMSVPVSQQNFLEFGVSSTPTLVLLDRDGIVRLYNPGDLPYDELASQIERLL
jgi:thiol-disulfide isomerase/thioredoxin